MIILTISYSFFLTCFVVLPFSFKTGFAMYEEKAMEILQSPHRTRTIEVKMLMPEATCANNHYEHKNNLKVVHKHGPCSQPSRGKTHATTSVAGILEKDNRRATSFQSWLSAYRIRRKKRRSASANEISIARGLSNYIVKMELGTPRQELSFIFDTTANLTWVKCKRHNRHDAQSQGFIPRHSKSYVAVHYSDSPSGEITQQRYVILNYGKGDSIKFLGKETLTLKDNTFESFIFGCEFPVVDSDHNPLGSVSGVLGLGQGKISFIDQSVLDYGKIFSYCLPSIASYTGYLRFGEQNEEDNLKYTPLVTHNFGFYGLNIIGMSVGGCKIETKMDAFSKSGTIIDSVAEITRLPHDVYESIRAEFRGLMTYPRTPRVSILDTCYNISGHKSISVPTISFFFQGGIEVDIDPSGILYVAGESEVCLAFTKCNDLTEVAVFGNMQQKTMKIVYDIAKGRIGFGPNGCS